MVIDRKLKKTIVDIALNPLLRNPDRRIRRTARNVMELGISLQLHPISVQEYDRLYEELLLLLPNADKAVIADWMLKHF